MFQRLRNIFTKSAKLIGFKADKVKIYNIPDYPRRNLNLQTYEELYQKNTDFNTAVNTIANFAITNFEFIGSEKDIKIAEEFAKKFSLRGRLRKNVRTMLIYGSSYEYLADDHNEFRIVMQFLDPKKVSVKVNEYGEITGYVYSIFEDRDIPPERMLHFVYDTVGNEPYGYGLIHPAISLIQSINKLQTLLYILSYRMSHPILHAKTALDRIDDVSDLLQERIVETEDEIEGIEVLNQVTTDRDTEITVLSSQLDISAVVKAIELLQMKLDRVLKVPKVFYGEPEGSNRATSYNQLKTFSLYLDSVRSIVKEELEAKLFPVLGLDVEIEFDEITIDEEFMWGELAAKLYEVGIIDTDEARELIGFPPLEVE